MSHVSRLERSSNPFSQGKVVVSRLAAAAVVAATIGAANVAPADAALRPVAAHTVRVSTNALPLGGGIRPDTLGKLHTITTLGSSQDPINLDQNPYGLAIAPQTTGAITKGDLVICNFNNGVNGLNIQSLGTTIEVLHPVVGARPRRLSSDPRLTGCGALTFDVFGGLEVMSYTANDIAEVNPANGAVTGSLSDPSLAGPWGGVYGPSPGTLGKLYVSNAYTGNIVRITPTGSGPVFQTVVSGITPNHGVPGAILAPAGLTYDASTDRLYIVDGNANRVLVLNNASRVPPNGIQVSPSGSFVGAYAGNLRVYYSGAPLNAPISSVMLSNGHLIVGNTGDNLLVDIGPGGYFSTEKLVDSGAAGAIFGLAATGNSYSTFKIYFNDDNDNTLKVLSQ